MEPPIAPDLRPERELDTVAGRWQARGAGARYSEARFRGRHGSVDEKLVRALADRHLERRPETILDVPCGSGRLFEGLASLASGPVTAVDASAAMLAAHPRPERTLRARAEQLPFPDRSFDLVVACRLLHHLAEERSSTAVLRELVRVTRGLLLVSYWEAHSWPGWRRRLGLSRPDPAGRGHLAGRELARRLEGVGGRLVGRRSRGGWWSAQVFAAVVPNAES